jgi:hypothetical protein
MQASRYAKSPRLYIVRCGWETLATFARDEKHLGAEIGATMVLHTWGQTLALHPHVHAIVATSAVEERQVVAWMVTLKDPERIPATGIRSSGGFVQS